MSGLTPRRITADTSMEHCGSIGRLRVGVNPLDILIYSSFSLPLHLTLWNNPHYLPPGGPRIACRKFTHSAWLTVGPHIVSLSMLV